MTYVRQQTSEELAAHMRYLQGLPGWHDPLADRLWQEVEALRAENAGLQTGYKAYEQVNAELRAEVEALRKLATELRGSAECNNVHHCTAEQHDLDEPCKVLARIDAAMAQGEQP